MKNLLLIIMLLISATVFGQKTSKYKEINFQVSGICGMCEDRIENALNIKGIRVAEWDQESGNCKVIYNTTKITEMEIHQAIAKAGHDTDKVKATKEDYDNLHGCCKYKEDVKH